MLRKEKIERLKQFTFELFPDAETELDYKSDFHLLIAILMSAQTTDVQVNKVNSVFFQVLKTPHDAIDLWIPKIETYINTISFFRNKARFIYQTCSILIEKYNWDVPTTLHELTALPWVGIKTAKVFLAVTQDAPYLWVDTHVHRVLNRTGIVTTKNANATDRKAEQILEKNDLALLHNTLIFFGRYYCIARKPKCEKCKLNDFCKYYKKQKKQP